MKAASNQTVRRAGFSLIELLFVLALMLALSAMMYGFGSSRRQKSQKVLCQDNLQKVYIALQIYAKDYNGHMPMVTNALTAEEPLDLLVPRYSADNSIFICPGGRDSALSPGASLQKGTISYAYYMGRRLDDSAAQWPLISDRQVNTDAKQSGDQLFSETGKSPGNNHHKFGGNFLFGDGSVQASPAQLAFPLATTPGVVLLNPKP
jgi:prepilin-type N-terminal cleavage/methylation domain-containing protein/prepilin-type processing-associated H-X9-DG protein